MTLQIAKKPIRKKYVKWRNIATFNNEREARDYMSAAKLASRGHRKGNKLNNKNNVFRKSESTNKHHRLFP